MNTSVEKRASENQHITNFIINFLTYIPIFLFSYLPSFKKCVGILIIQVRPSTKSKNLSEKFHLFTLKSPYTL